MVPGSGHQEAPRPLHSQNRGEADRGGPSTPAALLLPLPPNPIEITMKSLNILQIGLMPPLKKI